MRFGAVRRGSARFGAARQAIFAMETAWERWKIEADPSRTVKTQKFGIRHKGEEFTPADNIPRYVGVCHAKGQGCPGLVVFKVGKPTYVCGTATCKLQWQVQHGFKGPQRETPPEELAAVAGGGHGSSHCRCSMCIAGVPPGASTRGSSGLTPVPPEELAPADAGGGACIKAACGHTEAPLTRADLEKTAEAAGAKGAEAVLKSLGLGPGDLDRKLSLPSEHGALQNAQLHSLILPSSR